MLGELEDRLATILKKRRELVEKPDEKLEPKISQLLNDFKNKSLSELITSAESWDKDTFRKDRFYTPWDKNILRVRTKLAEEFESIDSFLESHFDELKQEICDAFLNNGKINKLIPESNNIEFLVEFFKTNKMLRVSRSLKNLNDFHLPVRTLIGFLVRKVLDSRLNPPNTNATSPINSLSNQAHNLNLIDEKTRENGKDIVSGVASFAADSFIMPGSGVVVGPVVKAVTDLTDQYVESNEHNNIDSDINHNSNGAKAREDLLKICRDAIDEISSALTIKIYRQVAEVSYALVSDLRDATVIAEDMERKWEKFYESHKSKIWPEEFEEIEIIKNLTEDWNNNIKSIVSDDGFNI